MRIHTMLTSSAALAALCALLVGGCGDGTQAQDGADPVVRDGALGGGAAPSVGTPGEASEAPKGEQSPASEAGGGSDKITICHVPPGNPANAHTLVVSRNGWNGHQRHKGDYAGPCGGSGGGEPDAGTSEPDAGTSEPDAGTSEPDAGTVDPVCVEADAACGAGDTCCGGLECREGFCSAPIIIN
jgi:hypothetical protein